MELQPLMEFLAVVLGTQPGAISQALIAEDGALKPKADIEAFLSPLVQQKLDSAKREGKEEGKGWGARESREGLESWIKETFGAEPTGDVKSQIQSLLTEAKKSSKLTEDDVKNSEIFLNEIKRFQDEIKTRDNTIAEIKEASRRERVSSYMRRDIDRLLEEENFIIPEDKDVAANLTKLYIASLWKEGIDFRADESGNITPTNEKGDPLKDNLHNPIGWRDYAKGNAKLFFQVREGNGKQSPGNTTTPPAGSGGTYHFKNREEAMNAYNNAKDPEAKAAITDAMRKIPA